MYIQSFYPLMLGGSRQHLYCWAMSTGFLPAKGPGTSSKFYHSSFCFCCSVTKSDSLQFHGLQHVRLPCPSLSPGVCSNSCPLSVMPSTHLILCHSLSLLPSVFPSIRVFSNELALRIRWPKYWSFNFSISPSNEYSGLISFRIDWFDLLAVQGTLKSSPASQFKSINSLELSLPYGPTCICIHDYWKKYSFDYKKFLAKWCLCFWICCLGLP